MRSDALKNENQVIAGKKSRKIRRKTFSTYVRKFKRKKNDNKSKWRMSEYFYEKIVYTEKLQQKKHSVCHPISEKISAEKCLKNRE